MKDLQRSSGKGRISVQKEVSSHALTGTINVKVASGTFQVALDIAKRLVFDRANRVNILVPFVDLSAGEWKIGASLNLSCDGEIWLILISF